MCIIARAHNRALVHSAHMPMFARPRAPLRLAGSASQLCPVRIEDEGPAKDLASGDSARCVKVREAV